MPLSGSNDALRDPRQAHLQAAHRAHDERRYAEAAIHYRAFVDAGGPASHVGVALGDVLSEAGDPRGAVEAYRVVFDALAGDRLPAVRLGQAAQRLGLDGLAREAWRAAAIRQGVGADLAVGGESPLVEAVDPVSADLMRRSGWPSVPTASPAPPSDGGWRDAQPRLAALDVPPPLDAVGLVASLRLEARVSGETVLRALRIAEDAACGRPLLILHVVAPPESAGVATLRHLIAARRAPICLAVHHPGAGPCAMLGMDLALAAFIAADVLAFDGVPDAEGPAFGGVFAADPLLGFASWTAPDREGATAPRIGAGAWRYGPMRPGCVTLVRDRVLLEAGGLDAVYEHPRAALRDLMLRANRMGFSAVSATVRGAPLTAGDHDDEADAAILRSRYPEHAGALHRAAAGPGAEVARLMDGLRRPSSLALDLTGLRAWHDGTAELSVALTRALVKGGCFELTAICSRAAADHHGLRGLDGLAVVPPDTTEVFGACLKIGQPFTWEELLRTWSYAPVAGFHMLDAISLDVERLNVADLETLWRVAFEGSALVGHLSRFTRDQMGERFGDIGRRGFVAPCSTAADEYGRPAPPVPADGPVLLVGNGYEHKNLLGAVRRIHVCNPSREMVVLGRVLQARPNVTWLDSGTLDAAGLEALYARAAAVVFPSFYEGFGLPIMHGLARAKPVLAIDQPVFHEIKARCRLGANLHLFPTTQALAAGLDETCRGGFRPPFATVREHRWSDAAGAVAAAVREAVAGFTPAALERRSLLARLAARLSERTASALDVPA